MSLAEDALQRENVARAMRERNDVLRKLAATENRLTRLNREVRNNRGAERERSQSEVEKSQAEKSRLEGEYEVARSNLHDSILGVSDRKTRQQLFVEARKEHVQTHLQVLRQSRPTKYEINESKKRLGERISDAPSVRNTKGWAKRRTPANQQQTRQPTIQTKKR